MLVSVLIVGFCSLPENWESKHSKSKSFNNTNKVGRLSEADEIFGIAPELQGLINLLFPPATLITTASRQITRIFFLTPRGWSGKFPEMIWRKIHSTEQAIDCEQFLISSKIWGGERKTNKSVTVTVSVTASSDVRTSRSQSRWHAHLFCVLHVTDLDFLEKHLSIIIHLLSISIYYYYWKDINAL